jgi:glycine/D-amino acid oxidase-like deaminating enzyme
MPSGRSRRDLLAAFLGLPAALAAGCGRGSPPLPEGEIVGASAGFGHRLRDGPRPAPAADAWTTEPVVIVGAGVAGLAAAWRLHRAGFDDFLMLELEPAAGGTARSGNSGVVPHPWGAHYVPAPLKEDRALVLLLREMGVVEGEDEQGEPVIAEEVLCRDPHERVHYRGRWYEGLYLHAGASDEDRAQAERFYGEVDRWVAWRDGRGRRAFTLPTAAGSDDPEVTALDRLSMAEWLDRKGLSSPRLRWWVEYACRDDYGATAADTSAWAGLFYLASRRRAPGAEPQPLMTWPEGNGRFVAHLARPLKERLRVGVGVADVIPIDPAGQRGVDLVAVEAKSRRALGFHAEQVIFAGPQFLARHVLRPYRESPPAHVAAFEYGSWLVANLHLSGRPAEDSAPLAWDNVLYESPSLGYVVATHQRGLDYGPTIFTWYYPFTETDTTAGRRRLLGLGWGECAELALSDLGQAHADIRQLTKRLDVMRWGHAMVRPRPGFLWGTARGKAAAPYRAVHFAHSDLSGLALFEEAFYHGLRAAEEVLAARGVRSPSLL